MFFELIAAVVAGGFGAGAVLIVNTLTGGLLPRWAMPAAAGAAMIGFGIFMEYNWFDRKTGEFPAGVEIVSTREARGFWRPWTYVWPITDGFTAVDSQSIRTNDAAPDQRMAQIVLMARWKAARVVPMIYDCGDTLAALLTDKVEMDDDGTVLKADWKPVEPDDPALTFVCKED